MNSRNALQSYYSVVRYVADPVRNEARNIGVVVLCPQLGYSKGRFNVSRSGLQPVSSRYGFLRTILVDLEISEGSQRSLFDLSPEFTLRRLEELHHELTNTIQFTEPMPVPANPDQLLDEVYSDFVASKRGGSGVWSRSNALKVFQKAFERAGIERFVQDTAIVQSDEGIPYVFDLGVKNGSWRAVIENISLVNRKSRHAEEKAAWMSRAWEQLAPRLSASAILFVEAGPETDHARLRRVSTWAEKAGVAVEMVDAAPRIAATLATELSHGDPGNPPLTVHVRH